MLTLVDAKSPGLSDLGKLIYTQHMISITNIQGDTYMHTFRNGFHERSRCRNDVTGSTCWSTIAPPVGFIGLVSHIITEL